MAIYGGPDIVTDGLVLHLDAANSKSYPGSGTSWFDLSGNNNRGVLINGPAFINENKGTIRTDGFNDYINILNNDLLGDNFTSFSIDLTIKPQTGAGADTIGYILHRSTTAIVGTSVYAIYMSGTTINFTINGTAFIFSLNNRNNILANYFYLWNGSQVLLYVNGVLNNTLAFNTFTNARANSVLNMGSTSLNIGYRPCNCNFYNFKIYNRALSASEINKNYNAIKGRYNL